MPRTYGGPRVGAFSHELWNPVIEVSHGGPRRPGRSMFWKGGGAELQFQLRCVEKVLYWQPGKRVRYHGTTFWRQISARPSTFPVLFPWTVSKNLVPAVLSHFQRWANCFGLGNSRPQISRFSLSLGKSGLIYNTFFTKFITRTVLFLVHSKWESSYSKQLTRNIRTSNDSSISSIFLPGFGSKSCSK